MKKLLVLFLMLAVVLCACKKPDVTEAITTEQKLPTTVLPVTEPDMTDATTAATEVTVVVTNETPEYGNDVIVDYEIIKIGDEEIDEILKSAGENALKDCIPNISSIEKEGGSAEYNVNLMSMYKGEKIISAVFGGTYTVDYGTSISGGDVLYTVNIDSVTGKVLETPDIIDYEKMLDAYKNGRFDKVPDFSPYNAAYGIYPYVSVEEVEGSLRLGIYVTSSGMYQEVFGYYINPQDAHDFLKINLTEKE